MANKSIFKILTPNTRIYLWIIGILIGILAFYEPKISAVGVLVLGYLVYHHWKNVHLKQFEWTKYIEELTKEFDSATKHAILNLPIPLVMVELSGSISWYNPKFADVINKTGLLNKNIDEIIPNFNIDDIMNSEQEMSIEASIDDRNYKVLYNVVKSNKESINKKNYIIMLYWIDITSFSKLKEKYNDEKINLALIQIDNYDEVKNSTDETNRPIVLAEIDRKINTLAHKINGLIRKYENDKYIIVFEHKYLSMLETKKFDILDEIREVKQGNTIPATLSVGVGVDSKNPANLYEFATAAMDIALGRGGDQAVVKKIGNLSFYGGKSKAVERRNKVKARVIAYALRQLMDQSDRIFIMGHKVPDMDSFGSSIGVHRAAMNRDKEAYIVLNDINPSIQNIYNRMLEQQPEYLNYIIKSEKAEQMVTKGSLCIVVDNHRPDYVEAPNLLKLIDKVVIIDHHRRGISFIDDPVLTYLEPYSSSACELVTEILYYMDDKLNLERFEAEALLAGISVDTKNFTFKTGVRTFEAASLLRRAGADTTSVRQLFQDDLNTFIAKADVVKNARIMEDTIAISTLVRDGNDTMLVTAQAADDLLNIMGITASFVLVLSEGLIRISARSLGDINVQLILEKLGGGGHLTTAGVQLENIDLHEAEKMLESAIKEYFEEGDEK